MARQLTECRENYGSRAPILEALIDFRCSTKEDLELEDLRSAVDPDLFGDVEEKTAFQSEFTFNVSATPTLSASHAVRGYRYDSSDGTRVVQVGRDGMTFSQLPPYNNWEELRDQAMRSWSIYQRAASGPELRRLSVRFINRIQLPVGPVKLEELFHMHPSMPAELGPMQDFSLRVKTHHPDDPNLLGIAAQTTVHDTSGRGIIIDISVFTEQQSSFADDELMTATLVDLRRYKNDIFFRMLTPQTRSTFK